MPRKANPVCHEIVSLDDMSTHPPWGTTPPGWLLQGMIEGLLSYTPEKKRGNIKDVIRAIRQYLAFPFEIHPEERLRWTDAQKQEAVALVLQNTWFPKGMLSNHRQVVFVRHARMTDLFLRSQAFPYAAQKNATRTQENDTKIRWLREHLPVLLAQLKATPCTCGRPITKLPTDDQFHSWEANRRLSVGTLVYQILAYHHKTEYATIYKQLNPKKSRSQPSNIPLDKRLWNITPDMPMDQQLMVHRTNWGLKFLESFGVKLP
jgi:hypothetical protein